MNFDSYASSAAYVNVSSSFATRGKLFVRQSKHFKIESPDVGFAMMPLDEQGAGQGQPCPGAKAGV